MFVVIQAVPDWSGADCIAHVFGPFETEKEAIDALAEMRTDNPHFGNGWTYMEVERV